MKCAKCGYFNIPGIDICGRCGSALASQSESIAGGAMPVSFGEIYPPRARDRSTIARVSDPIRRATSPALRPAASAIRALPIADSQPWVLVSFAVIPGVMQIFGGRARSGFLMLAMAVALVAGFLAAIHLTASDALPWMLGVLSVYSVWEVANLSFPDDRVFGGRSVSERSLLRAFRLGFLAVAIVAMTVVGVLAVAGRTYGLWRVQTDLAPPVLQAGDELVVRLYGPARSPALRRGDVVLYTLRTDFRQGVEVIGDGAQAERIIGLPGDIVGMQGGALMVNGAAVPSVREPLSLRVPVPVVNVTVPKDNVFVWRGFTVQGGEGGVAPALDPYVLVPREQIQGVVIAVSEPPARRRWFR